MRRRSGVFLALVNVIDDEDDIFPALFLGQFAILLSVAAIDDCYFLLAPFCGQIALRLLEALLIDQLD